MKERIKDILDKNGIIEFDAKGLQSFIEYIEKQALAEVKEKIEKLVIEEENIHKNHRVIALLINLRQSLKNNLEEKK